MAQVMAATSAALDGSAEAKPRLSLLRIVDKSGLPRAAIQFWFAAGEYGADLSLSRGE